VCIGWGFKSCEMQYVVICADPINVTVFTKARTPMTINRHLRTIREEVGGRSVYAYWFETNAA
jgi:hypothetical protein